MSSTMHSAANSTSTTAAVSLRFQCHTPSKRRCLSPSAADDNSPEVEVEVPSSQELWKWTLSNDGIAPCRVRDVFAMKENRGRAVDPDFFWLGRVPCRNVRLVGMVVGVQVFEKRVIYSIDDGTAVIDCVHRPIPAATSPIKNKPAFNKQLDKYKQPKLPVKEPAEPVPLVPIAYVGISVRAVGRVVRWHDSRQIRLDAIQPCTSANEEPLHWRTVLQLHRSSYSLPEPFTIPPPPLPSSTIVDPDESNDSRLPLERPSSPITASSAPSSAFPSPTKYGINPQSPPKLRHPSRLHSRDLTANTFRIYLKHYMDNAPPVSECREEVETDAGEISNALSRAPLTPTKSKSSGASSSHSERTPRSFHISKPPSSASDQTPRPPQAAGPSKNAAQDLGFTLSYLRRVPELSEMARRVVKAEAKRRAREERKLKSAQSQSQPRGKIMAPASTTIGSTSLSKGSLSSRNTDEPIAPKMKRLFQWAIVKLYEEGSIVLWDGSVRPLYDEGKETSGLWKMNATIGADSTIFSAISSTSFGSSRVGVGVGIVDDDDGELSDPPANGDEEAYIPLTPKHLAPLVEKAISNLMARSQTANTSARHKHARSELSAPAPPSGPTKEEITTFLRRMDGRWARVGEWVVEDALDVLRREDRVWCVGKGRWELCL